MAYPDKNIDPHYRFKVDNTFVLSSLSSFILYMDLEDLDSDVKDWVYDNIDAAGAGLRITDDDGNTVPIHVRNFVRALDILQGQIFFLGDVDAGINRTPYRLFAKDGPSSVSAASTTYDQLSAIYDLDSIPAIDPIAPLGTVNYNLDTEVGYIDLALEFDGSLSALDTGAHSGLDNLWSSGGSLECFIKAYDAGEGNQGTIISKHGDWNLRFDDVSGQNCRLRFEHVTDGVSGIWRTSARYNFLNNFFKHIVFEFDKDSLSNVPKMYVNGTEVPLTEVQAPTGTAFVDDSLQPLIIGALNIARDQSFYGLIDEVRFHNTTRSAQWWAFAIKNYDNADHELDNWEFVDNDGSASVEHTLTITQDISYTISRNRSVEHVLVIEQDIAGSVDPLNQTVEHDLVIQHDIGHSRQHDETIEHELNIGQYVEWQAPLDIGIGHDIFIEQDIEVGHVYELAVEHYIPIAQDIGLGGLISKSIEHQVLIEQDIALDDSGVDTDILHVEHELGIEQWVGGEGGTPFVDDEVPTGVRVRDVEHELSIEQSIGLNYGDGSGGIVGPGNSDPRFSKPDPSVLPQFNTDGSDCDPVLSSSGTVTLEYPTTVPTHTVTLPAPLMSNQESIEVQRIQRHTRGLKLLTYADPQWPEIRVFRMKFDTLTDTNRSDMFTFFSASLGRPIKFTDHEGQEWIGVLINPNGEFAEFDALCDHTAELDFATVPNV